jgi:hypothetical protein
MRRNKEFTTTTNLGLYNKLYRHFLEQDGKIRCSWCKPHRGENATHGWYGVVYGIYNKKKWEKPKFPNWKLVSKNRKQWMKKPLTKEEFNRQGVVYGFEIKWPMKIRPK